MSGQHGRDRLREAMARAYRALLVAYPKGFREEYGDEMGGAFEDLCREEAERGGLLGLLLLWARTLPDLLLNAAAERSKALALVFGAGGGYRPGTLFRLCWFSAVVAGPFAVRFLFWTAGVPVPWEEGWPYALPMVALWLLAMPLAQYAVMRLISGARPVPSFGLGVPAFSLWRAPGHRFPRRAFAAICSVPFLIAWVVMPLYVVPVTLNGGGGSECVFLLGLTMGLSVKDLWFAAIALGQPRGTLVEERRDSGHVTFHVPARR